MLLPYLQVLGNKAVILGSQSKTRNELMKIQRVPYKSIPSTFAEDLDKTKYEDPAVYNMDTCRGKVTELLERFKKENIKWDLLICGDTILEHQGQIIEKPANQEHCIEMVKGLSNQTHRLYTAHIVIFNTQPEIRYEWVAKAEVTFGQIPIQVIKVFAKEPEPYIHSGAYQITALSGSFLKSIQGSHTAVQGLDMYELCNKIIEGSRKAGWIQ